METLSSRQRSENFQRGSSYWGGTFLSGRLSQLFIHSHFHCSALIFTLHILRFKLDEIVILQSILLRYFILKMFSISSFSKQKQPQLHSTSTDFLILILEDSKNQREVKKTSMFKGAGNCPMRGRSIRRGVSREGLGSFQRGVDTPLYLIIVKYFRYKINVWQSN